MILKASQRGGAMQLATHLLKSENEHVEVHEIRGFVADDLKGAMKEAQAVAKGTRCKQHLFSVSLNPPESEAVGTEKFESAIERIEQANGLTGQPRIVVFHEKEGRRHAHCVWSRIDAETMTAKPLPFFKAKLREVSKSLYLEHGWRLPRGLVDSREHDPRNFSLAEWQQAKRIGRDPRKLKALVQECWAMSDGRPAFEKALQERGLHLAKGDRRAHVAVTYEGEVISISRLVGVKSKQVTAKLGNPETTRSVADTKAHIAATVAPRLEALIKVTDAAQTREMKPIDERRQAMAERHADERHRMRDGQRARFDAESRGAFDGVPFAFGALRRRLGLCGIDVGHLARLGFGLFARFAVPDHSLDKPVTQRSVLAEIFTERTPLLASKISTGQTRSGSHPLGAFALVAFLLDLNHARERGVVLVALGFAFADRDGSQFVIGSFAHKRCFLENGRFQIVRHARWQGDCIKGHRERKSVRIDQRLAVNFVVSPLVDRAVRPLGFRHEPF